jgi:16S rRNA (guanine966-N2)-methyltransferase
MAKQSGKAKQNYPPGRLRIVAGIWRSRLLDIADADGLRPTPERVRETLFNWLSPKIVGARCLDLYAGTGALGLEALSRGAAESVFVENSAKAANALRRNVAVLGADAAVVRRADALDYLRSKSCGKFDIVFLDPPFAADMLEDLCRLLEEQSVLTVDARVYLEQDRARQEPVLPDGWEILKKGNAGKVSFSLVKPGSGGVTK